MAQVAHHIRRELWKTGKPVKTRQFRAYAARLGSEFEDLRGAQVSHLELFNPSSDAQSQAYGEQCRAAYGDGIIYGSVRLAGDTNAVAYRPAKTLDVMQTNHWRITTSLDTAPVAQRIRV